MTINEKISARRKELGLTLEEVAKIVGVGKSTVRKWETGDIANMKRDKIALLAKALKVSPAFIMGFTDDVIYVPSNAVPVPEMVRVPLIGDIACGTPILAKENIIDYVECPKECQADFALRCHGDSMVGARILDNDIVLVRTQTEVNDGEIAVVQIEDDEDSDWSATLKRYYRHGDVVTLMAENPEFPPLVFSGKEINRVHIAGRAVYFISKIK